MEEEEDKKREKEYLCCRSFGLGYRVPVAREYFRIAWLGMSLMYIIFRDVGRPSVSLIVNSHDKCPQRKINLIAQSHPLRTTTTTTSTLAVLEKYVSIQGTFTPHEIMPRDALSRCIYVGLYFKTPSIPDIPKVQSFHYFIELIAHIKFSLI